MKRRHILHTNKYVHAYSLADAVPKALYLSAVTLLCFYSAVGMALDIFPDWQLTAAAWRWVCGSVVVISALDEIGVQALPKYRGMIRVLAAAVLALVFYRYAVEYQIELEDGACAFGTQFLEKYNRHLKTSFYIWKGREEYISMSFAFWCICTVTALLFVVLITGRRIFLLAMPAAVLSALLMIGFVPQWKGLALFLAAVMTVYAAGDDRRKRTMHVRIDGRQRAAHLWYMKWVPVACLAGGSAFLLLLGSIIFQMPSQELMNQSPKVQEFQKKTERDLESAMRGYFTPRSENIRNQSPKYSGKEVIKVTASEEPAADVYLKGFYGTDYQNGTWVCNKDSFQEICREAGIGPEDAAVQLLQSPYDVFSKGTGWRTTMLMQGQGGWQKPEEQDILYTIEQEGLYHRYAYLPYAIDFVKDRSTERVTGDVTVQKGWGQKKFTFHGWNQPFDQYAVMRMADEQEKEVFQWYDRFAQSTYLGLSDQVSDLNEYLDSLERVEDRPHERDENGNIIVNFFSGLSGREIKNILQMYEEQLEFFKGNHIQMNQARIGIAQFIGLVLKQYHTYSLELDAVPAGMDAVDYFLMSSRRGYCVHFASAAVLMLRQIGIPARYVSGYVARKSEFKYSSSTGVFEASIKDSSAHAWVEIYLNQIGWIPIDVTPGQNESRAANNSPDQADGSSSDHMQQGQDDTDADETQADTDTDDTGADDTDTDDTGADDTDTDDTKADDEAGGSSDADGDTTGQGHGLNIISLLPKIAAAAGILLALISVCLAAAYAVRRYQEILRNDLKSGRYRRAVLRINRRIYRKMLLRGRIRRQHMTDADYGRLLEKYYTCIEAADWAHYMRILQEAVFARKELQQEDAYFCYKVYRKI